MFTFKNYTIADWLSFYRIAAVPILLVLLWFGEREIFTWFLLVSYSTDAIDGYLARKLKIISERGAQLDSIGDQLTFIVGLIGLWVFEKAFIKENLLLIDIAFVPYIVQMFIAFKPIWQKYQPLYKPFSSYRHFFSILYITHFMSCWLSVSWKH